MNHDCRRVWAASIDRMRGFQVRMVADPRVTLRKTSSILPVTIPVWTSTSLPAIIQHGQVVVIPRGIGARAYSDRVREVIETSLALTSAPSSTPSALVTT